MCNNIYKLIEFLKYNIVIAIFERYYIYCVLSRRIPSLNMEHGYLFIPGNCRNFADSVHKVIYI